MKKGFTLIELMTAMTILAVMVLMMVMVFNNTDKVWFLGTGRAINCTAGRAAMNLLSHDLQYAAADDVLTFATRQDRKNVSTFAFKHDEACFVSIQNDSKDGNRAVREMFYYVTNAVVSGVGQPGSLMRGYYSTDITNMVGVTTYTNHCYFNTNWFADTGSTPPGVGRPGNARSIVEHVTAFSVYSPTNKSGRCPSAYYSTANSNALPEYVDVYLEVLDDQIADQVSQWPQANKAALPAFVERNARRYTTRVYFQNRQGYKNR